MVNGWLTYLPRCTSTGKVPTDAMDDLAAKVAWPHQCPAGKDTCNYCVIGSVRRCRNRVVNTSSDLRLWETPVRGPVGVASEAGTSQRVTGNQHVLDIADLETCLRDHNNSKEGKSTTSSQGTIKAAVKGKLLDVVRLKAEVDEIISGNLPLERIETYEPDDLLFIA